jgi:hypothetical protein
MKLIFIPCVDRVYSRISLKEFLVTVGHRIYGKLGTRLCRKAKITEKRIFAFFFNCKCISKPNKMFTLSYTKCTIVLGLKKLNESKMNISSSCKQTESATHFSDSAVERAGHKHAIEKCRISGSP